MSFTDPMWPYLIGSLVLFFIAYQVSNLRQKRSAKKILKQSLHSDSVRENHFRMLQKELAQSFNEETDPPRDRKDLIVELFDACGFEMSEELPDSLLLFANEDLTDKQKWYLRFECLVYLFFWSDVSAFSNNQNEHTRQFLRNAIDYVLQGFIDREASLEELVDIRLANYTRGYQSGGPMSSAQHLFLHNLQVLVESGSIRRTIALPFRGIFESANDWAIVATGISAQTIFLKTLKTLFDAGDFERMSAAQIKTLVAEGIQKPKPFGIKPAPQFSIR